MTDLQPLPRSLDPLSDEVLPGYLLRLAHRLDRSPGRILQLTGLTGGNAQYPSRTSIDLMIELNPATADAFGRLTRLSPQETAALCLRALTPRYPIPPLATTWQGRTNQIMRADWWILSTSSRYCPLCLAGDESPIQQDHGGPWRRSWRLPVVFACTRHDQLLQHVCPDCGRPTHNTIAGTGRIPLMQALRVAGMHPAQCRSHGSNGTSGIIRGVPSICGARLDTPIGSITLPRETLILQDRISGLLASDGPTAVMSAGQTTEPARYFADLRLLTLLITLSWPRAAPMAPSSHLAEAIDRHVALYTQSEQSTHLPAWVAQGNTLIRTMDPAATAGLLSIADRIITTPDTLATRANIQSLLQFSGQFNRFSRWQVHFLQSNARSDCSPGLLRAVIPLVQAFPRQGRQARRAPQLKPRFGPEHVPQRLPDDLFQHYLSHLGGISPSLLRRTAAVRLVQMINGGPLAAAAQYLGLSTKVVPDGLSIP
ncbi:TniQ family protein [Nonomuraea sp. NPDC049400]|uniref:TniQ family protein n=1 Tax=Nonomuraea sp. NPDC049400 TaxID=3364352 RepID=UPI0037A38A46